MDTPAAFWAWPAARRGRASRPQAFARLENEVLDRDDVLAHAGNVEQDDLMGGDVVVLCDAEVRIEPTSPVELTRRDVHLGEAREMQCAEFKLVLPICRVGIEIGDDVTAKVRAEHEHVVAVAAGQRVATAPANKRIVTRAAVEPVAPRTAIH